MSCVRVERQRLPRAPRFAGVVGLIVGVLRLRSSLNPDMGKEARIPASEYVADVAGQMYLFGWERRPPGKKKVSKSVPNMSQPDPKVSQPRLGAVSCWPVSSALVGFFLHFLTLTI